MDNMHFEEEIQDKEYFEDKIEKMEERIKILEDKAVLCGDWPENIKDLEERANHLRMNCIAKNVISDLSEC